MLSGNASRRVISLYHRLPKVEVGSMIGLLEALGSEEFKKDSDLSTLAEELYLDVDDLMSIIDCLEILRLAFIDSGHVSLTPSGIQFSEADILERKQNILPAAAGPCSPGTTYTACSTWTIKP